MVKAADVPADISKEKNKFFPQTKNTERNVGMNLERTVHPKALSSRGKKHEN
jgi:hypothetical protein